jgi:signal transduction histidine kinase
MLGFYVLALAAFIVVALGRDAAFKDASARPDLIKLGPVVSHRIDHGAFLDGEALVRSLAERPFEPSTGVRPNAGLLVFEDGYLWVSAAIGALPVGESDWSIWIEDRFSRAARLVVVEGTRVVREIDWRYGDPANSGLARKTHPVFHLQRADIENRTLYFALSSYGGLKGDLLIAPRPAFETLFERRFILLSFVNGAVAAIAIYLGAIGLRLGARSFLYAAGMAFFLMIRNFGETGAHHAVFLPQNPILADVMLYGMQPVAMSFWLLFTLSFLDIKAKAPRLHALVTIVAILIPIQGILIVLRGGFIPSMPFNTSAAFPTFLAMAFGFGLLFWQVAAGSRRAIWFLLCWIPIGTGLALRMTSYLVTSWTPDLGIFARQGPDLAVSLVALAVVLTIDLQERERRLTQVANRNAQRTRDFAEIGSDAMIEVGPDGVIRASAGPLTRTLGLAAGRALADTVPSLPASLVTQLHNEPIRALEHNLGTTDQKPLWLSISAVPVRDEAGAADGFRAVLADISEKVAERDTEARRNTLAALGQLAGGIAHEVNNLLHPMINLSRRVSGRLGHDPDGRRLLDLVVTSGERAGEIVRQVLKAYAPDRMAGGMKPADAAFADAVETIRATLPQGVQLETLIEPVPGLTLNGGELIQVLSNLTTNAVRAMRGNGRLSLRLTHDPDAARITVTDTGHGMPDEIRLKALDAFVTASPGGIGLGLSIVHRIVAGWQGTIDIDSTPGTGTTVRIDVPRPQRPLADAMSAAPV